MNNDRDFLLWLHDRIVYQYGENENVDFMWALRSIIANTDPNKMNSNVIGWTRQQLENLDNEDSN